jgi:cytidyltransferase-like protein
LLFVVFFFMQLSQSANGNCHHRSPSHSPSVGRIATLLPCDMRKGVTSVQLLENDEFLILEDNMHKSISSPRILHDDDENDVLAIKQHNHSTTAAVSKPVRGYLAGCWDIMHSGHYNAIRQAKSICDELVVGIHSDEEITKAKGLPVMKTHERYNL